PGSGSTYASPAALPAGGAWGSWISGYGGSDWFEFTAQANRTASVAVTALDETGQPVETKLQPVIGIWQLSDQTGNPAPASTPSAFNTTTWGMTRLDAQFGLADTYRAGVADFFLPCEPALFGYGYPGAPQSRWRRHDSQRHRVQTGTAGDSSREQRQHSVCLGNPDPGCHACRIARRNRDDPGYRSVERRIFPNDWRADLWRSGHGSAASVVRCGAGHASGLGGRQSHPRAGGGRRWSYAGKRGNDCLECDQ